ncbi:MAG: alginate lyase [Verrucomicrobiaceae bacterium]|nr:alginate lyase [Verrucomicrobiaceae bacterium]
MRGYRSGMCSASWFLRPVLILFISTTAMAQQFTLKPDQQLKLRDLIAKDKAAGRQFARVQAEADYALTATPNPVKIIESEGKLKSDPDRIATVKSLADMRKVEVLGWAFAVSGKAEYGDKAKAFILAWARVNEPQGDPINETKLEPLLVGYDLIQGAFSAPEKAEVAGWLRKIASTLVDRQKKKTKATSFNNWHSHRLKMLGLCGWLLQDSELIDRAVNGFREQIANNLLPDGSSFDFHERDALHYHCYDLEPLLALATAAKQQGTDLYQFTGTNGASLAKAVEFLVPYCDGSKTHAEFVNSKVEFDRKRSEAGQREFATGKLFDPKDALEVLELATLFDPQLEPLTASLKGKKTSRFTSWQAVLNEVRR